ncbi:hypothetical protein [Pseudonocardia sp. HH130630-07]|uniref:hypothetical protein n=1 Tax=Pseudonocardia sp. HH130630-07 TaxID=1690815 RepID=UPI000814BD77|nr:hypothetical protein [Pseudonocardia sp. HH130630-07]ANY08432.1 hypothetical protein AFB00_21575 [Pseudonocardia sp. HH130630-07]
MPPRGASAGPQDGAEDLTGPVAGRLGVDPRVLAVVVGAPWRRMSGSAGPGDGAGDPAHAVRGRVFVGVPSPAELTALDLPADGLRHFGLSPAELRAGGWTDADLRAAGLPVPGGDDVEWFVAGEPPQLLLGIDPAGRPRLARPEPRNEQRDDGVVRVLGPVDAEQVPDLTGCTDPEGAAATGVRAVRDRLLRTARRQLVHCAFCLRQTHRAGTGYGACPDCAARWLGVVDA